MIRLARRPAPGLFGLVLAGALLAGCTTGSTPGSTAGPGTGPSGPSTPTLSSPPGGGVTTGPPATAGSPPGSAPASGTSGPSSPPDTAAVPTASACTDLKIRVLQGGATPGREIAAVTFANDSGRACTVSGYPTVVLTYNGDVIATATPASGTVARPVRLAPGEQAQAMITDHSTCDAPLSDTIEVSAPNGAAGGQLTRPFKLRGCTVYVDPVEPAP